MMTCWLFRWTAGAELPHAAHMRRHPHLEQCGQCRAWLDEQSSLVARLRASADLARLVPPPILASRLAFVRAQLDERAPSRRRGFWPWTLMGAGGVAMALFLLLPRHLSPPPPPTYAAVLDDLPPLVASLPRMAERLENPLKTELQNLQTDTSRAVAALAREFLPSDP
jgi:hypothetical protein